MLFELIIEDGKTEKEADIISGCQYKDRSAIREADDGRRLPRVMESKGWTHR